ncbi:AAT family amino acid transporter [Cryptococcus neoformans C23]|uniref:AAT family amino acid transporter n=2 Tax=Cryptococcus neoformans TaxID=5207 RepID=A0A854QDT0_CRYNE|nr:AAT family amino acid transporter [Cryptococcus neoformans var. grubii H99]AUB24770.1 AAT family amino acid transporter [Cryptococcus neoformans var. grubii]OWZ32482.1 AAT family amino acid transporter [Cryptococcus neoformans var. grubii AD2-60a]OWZ44004.1 AAT family amino acid transporter [Cryptococcus neoformans var. grubii AD1-83a]OWZ44329.1 AAT family amino acid transporter [Cryptococcus neoformans var. grubii C23]OXC84798.1 AAT family amino acid transporter [Cryptococcus neoformans va|eukprot:XP_012049053.1 AAT family amino acid transporter [Cryptococcus neoformans var. grubii H99]
MSTHLEHDDKKDAAHDYTQQVTPADAVPSSDVEDVEVKSGLKRNLKSRHMAMISLGGVIGTGLFLGTGSALANGGPLGLFLGYATMGSICYCVMICLGEMISFLPIPGGHIKLAERFVDPALAFTMGWNYWYNWVIILPAELSAAAVLINLWNDTINNALWISICLVVVVAINFLGFFGECEFWFASIKILTIVGLIILGIVITAGGGPDHRSIGFQYWRNPGPFVQYDGISGVLGRFLGYWAVLTQAAFSYIGTEIVAIAAGEAKNPRRNLPRAIKRVYIRILIFYLGGTFIIGLLVPSNDEGLALNSGNALASPFVIAIRRAGIPVLPSIINACLLTSAWSAASSDLYTSSRALYGLSIARQAPKIFSRTTRRGLPWISISFCALFAALSYMSLQSTAGEVFGYFSNLTAAAGLMTWWGICLIYIRFEKGLRTQGIARSSLPYRSRLNYRASAAWYGIIMITIILFFSAWSVFLKDNWSTSTFVTNYLPLWLFPILWISYKYIKKTHFVRASEMDFVSGLEAIEAECHDEAPPSTILGKFWALLM